jgi:hypothetical protein
MSQCLAKSKEGKITVVMKEKYGPAKKFTHLTVIMLHDNAFYLIAKRGTVAVLPEGNWAIVEITGNEE